MKRKGYIVSLFVFMIFIAVFLVAVTNIKASSMKQESSYDRIGIMKASRFANNLEEVMDTFRDANLPTNYQGFCSSKLEPALSSFSDEVAFTVAADCITAGPDHYSRIRLNTSAFDYEFEHSD
jgi:hypothetical protein